MISSYYCSTIRYFPPLNQQKLPLQTPCEMSPSPPFASQTCDLLYLTIVIGIKISIARIIGEVTWLSLSTVLANVAIGTAAKLGGGGVEGGNSGPVRAGIEQRGPPTAEVVSMRCLGMFDVCLQTINVCQWVSQKTNKQNKTKATSWIKVGWS